MAKYFRWGCLGCSGIILVTFLSCTACNYFLNEKIMQGKIFSGLIPYVSLINPPNDLKTPILAQQLDVTKIDSIQSFKINHRYVGDYQIRIFESNLLNKHIINMNPEPFKFTIDVNFKIDNNSVYHSSFVCEPFFSLQPISASAANPHDYYINTIDTRAIHYSVPKDVPVNKEIELELIINKDAENFYKRFGNPTITIEYYSYTVR